MKPIGLDLRHMLKVYNTINDEQRPKFNIKFLALYGALAVASLGLFAFALTVSLPAQPSDEAAAGGSNLASQSETKKDYVGLSPAEISSGLASGNVVQERLASWQEAHPQAQIEKIEPVYEDGRLVGYEITYEESE